MQNDYARFLDYRVTERQLAAKFARPRLLLLHVIAFVVVMTAILAYGTGTDLWRFYPNFILPNVAGAVWSLILAAHAVLHFRRSAARHAHRERAVEDEMREFIAKNRDAVDSETLFDMHRALENKLEREGRWSVALAAFALVNAASWTITLANPASSWALQTTLPFALMIVGGVQAYLVWQQQRAAGRNTWFTRLPLWHIFAYPVGVIVLWALGAYRAINSWDANRLAEIWLVVLLAHIVWNVVVLPTLQWGQARLTKPQKAAKKKLGRDVTIGDDGELVALAEDDEIVDVSESDTSATSDTPVRGSVTGIH